MIALSLAACKTTRTYHNYYYNGASTQAAGGNSATQPSGNGATATQPSGNSGNTATQPSNNNGNTATQPSNNGGNTATQPSNNGGNSATQPSAANDNPPPFTLTNNTPDFSVSVSGLKREAEGDVRKLAAEYGVDDATVLSYRVSTLGQNANSGSLDLSKVPLKELTRADHTESAQVRAKGEIYTLTRSGESHIYRQNYSLIAGIKPTSYSIQGPGVNETEAIRDEDYLTIKGTPTKTLPAAGKATYSGAAFDGRNQGVLNYSVDFEERTGEGNITGLGEKVVLNKGSITHIDHNNEIDGSHLEGHGIKGSSNKGDYELGFFGANAEEIVGTVTEGTNSIGFAGSR
ncbi:factor H binding protein domain-containing protein [Neisseria sp. Marseille-Q1983]